MQVGVRGRGWTEVGSGLRRPQEIESRFRVTMKHARPRAPLQTDPRPPAPNFAT